LKAETKFEGISTTVSVPGSKSLTQRVLIAASLACGNSFVSHALVAGDTLHLISGLQALGARVESAEGGYLVCGTAGEIKNNGKEIFLGYNGTALRFLTAMVCLGRGKYVLTGEKRLCERPVGALVGALQGMGVDISCRDNCPPVEIMANGLSGGKIILRDIESSQYVSALLLCAPYTSKGIELTLQGDIVSAPYIDLTISVMKDFGADIYETGRNQYSVNAGNLYHGREYHVEGDASSASYFFLAAALLKKVIRVSGITRHSKQGDIRLLDILEELGCSIKAGEHWVEVAGTDLAEGNFSFDLNDMPDMVPTLAILAAFRKGQTLITNVAHLRIKESNRLAAMVTELNRIGIDAQELPDGLIVEGGRPTAASIHTYNDHRIAMSFAIAGLLIRGIEISDKKCVDKSFPEFWKELKKI
jgi:3-phosphoshikimate 1-carboxyvinyltransferase